ncbi:MAG TPA: hypothetical protein DDW54_01765 [Clostridiales bacterium]|nr:hypothetical protein [Clostridiales bacterium]
MAIINCPHCGQKTSDTNEICFHCGKSWKDVPEPKETPSKNDYNKLSLSQKTQLRERFYRKYPKYRKAYKLNAFWDKTKIITILIVSIFSSLWTILQFLVALKLLDTDNIFFGVLTVVLTALIAISIIFPLTALILRGKRRYRAMLIEKKYWQFITVEKNFEYTVMFDGKDKKARMVFEKIDLDYEDL